MTKREVVIQVLNHKQPPYVPWHFGFTVEAKQKLLYHSGSYDIIDITDNHILQLGDDIGYFKDIGNVDDVKKEGKRLLELGKDGGYIFAPSHDVEGDVPIENILAFIELAQNQDGYKKYLM